MDRNRSLQFWIIRIVGITAICIGVVVLMSWLYTLLTLRMARSQGVYASAEEGMLANIAKGYVKPDRTEILYAGTNSFDGSSPHVWYVIACVWGGHRLDGSHTGSKSHNYDQPGSFFLDTGQGWVNVSEGAFPQFVGFWMQVYGLAGPGSSQPTHDWGSSPQLDCTF